MVGSVPAIVTGGAIAIGGIAIGAGTAEVAEKLTGVPGEGRQSGAITGALLGATVGGLLGKTPAALAVGGGLGLLAGFVGANSKLIGARAH